MPPTKRPRVIPTKRPLLPPRPSRSSCVNPSSKSADIQIRKPAFSSLPDSAGDDNSSNAREGQDERGRQVNIECDFSKAPQPFLDPEVWNRMRKGDQGSDQGGEVMVSGDSEEEERKREREAEYGGLAIQSRTARRKRG